MEYNYRWREQSRSWLQLTNIAANMFYAIVLFIEYFSSRNELFSFKSSLISADKAQSAKHHHGFNKNIIKYRPDTHSKLQP